MRVAALYDIHGMLEPLQAVVRELEDEQFDAIVIGGDAISGPQPAETFEILCSLGTPMHWIRGNGERALGADALSAVVGDVEDALRFTASYFSDAERRRLSSLPEVVVLEVDGLGDALFCHASPRNDLDIVTPGTPDDRFRELLDGVPQRVIVSGHTHMQFDRWIDGVRWINPGSVGMPYEGEVAAFWALLGPDVELRRTPFDVDRHMESLLASGWPEAKLFVEENVRAVLPREEAVRLFEHMAAERGER